jgi:sugar phosphate isomerase/epimerase
MKLAFSTLGCPDWTWEDIFATAKDMGIDGIEVRGMGNEMHAPLIRPFLPEHIEATKKQLGAAGMEIPMLTSSACIGCNGELIEKYFDETKEYIDLAQALGTPFIRVLCSKNPQPDTVIDIGLLEEIYSRICLYGETRGVTPLIETNGELADSSVMAKFLRGVKSANHGVLWDIHHPFRYFGESPEQTAGNLAGEIKYLHVKDSVMKNGKVQYRMMGYGDVPVLDALRVMTASGYEGYVSLEWVKRWNPDLEDAGIVFSHFANYMKWMFKAL